jgi:serine phosphatase RsbU (regulator of sigma subunit)
MFPMVFKKTSLLVLLLGLLMPSVHAQPNPYGLPRIHNHHFSETGGGEQNWSIVQDFRGVIYVGNHDNGILEYDGSSWRTIPVTGDTPVRSMVSGDDGWIYAGLEGDFGRLEPDRSGEMHFRSLVDSTVFSIGPEVRFWKTYYREDKVYFCSPAGIYVFDPVSEQSSLIETPANSFFSFFVHQDLFLGNYATGLMKYEEKAFVPFRGGGFFKEKNISGLVAFDHNQYLVATFDQGLFLLNIENGNIDSTFLNPALKETLAEAVVINLQVQENRIFAGTAFEGLFILDRQGNIMEVLSEYNGLIDNAMADVLLPDTEQRRNSLWIAHWKGISRVDINSPFRSVSVGPGRMGFGGVNTGELITDITEFQGQLFVSTMGGLQRMSTNPQRPGFRPVRGIRGEIHDLQVLEPVPGKEYLLAIGNDRTFVLDANLDFTSLEAGGQKLLTDPADPGIFYVAKNHLTRFRYQAGQWKEDLKVELENEAMQMSLDKEGYIWITTRSSLLRLDISVDGPDQIKSYDEGIGLPDMNNLILCSDPQSRDLLVGTSNGIYHYDYRLDTVYYDSLFNQPLPEGRNRIAALHRGAEDLYWFSFENQFLGWGIVGARRSRSGFEVIYDRSFRTLSQSVPTPTFFTDDHRELWFSKSDRLFHFDPSLANETEEPFDLLIREVRIDEDSILFYGTNFIEEASGQLRPQSQQSESAVPGLKYQYREIEFQWSSPYFQQERRIQYSYFLDGFSKNWSNWDRNRSAKFTNLPHGYYTMQVKARNIYGDESPVASYAFSISRPWYATFLAISLYLILGSSLTVSIILYTRQLKRRAELLERQNKEIELQKKELESLNEEITSQRDEIEAQRDSLTAQKELIGKQKNALTDSIYYAKRIQDAVFPADEVLRFLLPKHFVFYRPRDIVSGDFYWVDKKDETVWIAVADCTGHGVPGAFMSMLGISLLNEISGQYSGQPTNEIMDELRDQVISSLGQTGDKYEARDGMEMGLIAINTRTREVQFTGAMHNLVTFQKGKMVIIKGDRMPVGIHAESSTLFSVTNLKLDRGDTLYLFSDGYADQFGGEQRKKYGSVRLKSLLKKLQNNIMHDQKEALTKEFETWKGEEEQIDDVLMVGIKL